MPIWNISRIRPIWLMIVMGAEACAPNNASEVCGKKCPINDGPNSRPAKISPITPGWPMLRNTEWHIPRRADHDDQLQQSREQQILSLSDRGGHDGDSFPYIETIKLYRPSLIA